MARPTQSTDLEFHIRNNYSWTKVPPSIKQSLGNSQKEWDRNVFEYSVKNQLRYKGNLVRHVRKDERKYYEDLLSYSKEHLMLYPYHLSDVIVKGLRVTPFGYYIDIMKDVMSKEKSYDSLPNFTAADCLRLLGIGRNQYIDLMNQCRSSRKFFRRRPIRDLLPIKPVSLKVLEPWWRIQVGFVTEDDIKSCSQPEHDVIDELIDLDGKPRIAGEVDKAVVQTLYMKGLIYVDVPINDNSCIVVPPLENFVMNRVLGDYFETLLYKIFVSIDEHTNIGELANVLQIDLQLVKNAVSVYCRLGFAFRKETDEDVIELHPSWELTANNISPRRSSSRDNLLVDFNSGTTTATSSETSSVNNDVIDYETSSINCASPILDSVSGPGKRIGFLFDSALTAFLMMGNLSPGLKNHAVTLFEVGKLTDESLDSLLLELEKVGREAEDEAEGEAERYFHHAITLRNTLLFLRYNKELFKNDDTNLPMGVDMLRCESLNSLDAAACSRVLQKNYSVLLSMAPLSSEIRPIISCDPPHLGPSIPEVNSVWFKLFLYEATGSGPPSMLIVKGTRLRKLPKMFQEFDRLLIATWGHDPTVVPVSNVLVALNDALSFSAVLVQGYGMRQEGKIERISFPLSESNENLEDDPLSKLTRHPAIQTLSRVVDLQHQCGYITLLNAHITSRSEDEPSEAIAISLDFDPCDDLLQLNATDPGGLHNGHHSNIHTEQLEKCSSRGKCESSEQWVLLDMNFGLPLFDETLNKEICEKISKAKLCQKSNLEKQLYSSRQLALRLLDFIAANQDTPLLQDSFETTSNSEHHSCPYPTSNIVFENGTLTRLENRK